MNDIKLAVLGGEGVGKSALIVRFLTRRFIGEYSSSSECIYRKRLSIDGRQLNLELYDPCSQACEGKGTLTDRGHYIQGLVMSVLTVSHIFLFPANPVFLSLSLSLSLSPSIRDADTLVFLVGNKQDLCHVREVRREEGQRLAAESQTQFYELSAAEHYQEVVLMFSKMVHNASLGGKAKERRRRPSGSKSMAKLINNVFGKRRKSV
ncbi:ras-related and estrogen-regulated growth inhibitor-like protein [Oncorhynchus keta]|uniref:ras-related and estrogen-regulated growth inhibitor-like protein n=1 Tax=Oncorhynchus keta TaxID=8018 RepID=UPI00227B787F|nr:ras-related and estrogen-regulated growth inhibitor-like protein [Oncorhynchus keta]